MEISLVHNKEQWNTWLAKHGGSFLQSWEWGEILVSEDKRVERLLVMNGTEVIGGAQIVYTKLPWGMKYGFCAGGPTAQLTISNEQLTDVWKVLKDFFSRKILFFRVEPSRLLIDNCSLLIYKSIDLTPRATTILDITQSDDKLLAHMHEKTRYNIRLAQKKNLKTERLKDFESFWKLMQKTGERDGFRLHSEKHYQVILASSLVHQITIYHNERPIVVGIFVGFGETLTYLFGASDHEFRNLMAPHLMQWEGIQLGKKLGYSWYDFFGIAPAQLTINNEQLTHSAGYQYHPKHQYAGVTRFKLGFGGRISENPGTYDLIVFPVRYRIYQVLRKLRRSFSALIVQWIGH